MLRVYVLYLAVSVLRSTSPARIEGVMFFLSRYVLHEPRMPSSVPIGLEQQRRMGRRREMDLTFVIPKKNERISYRYG